MNLERVVANLKSSLGKMELVVIQVELFIKLRRVITIHLLLVRIATRYVETAAKLVLLVDLIILDLLSVSSLVDFGGRLG